jgi:protein-S-isoprenylcysteine O-methyltransferase Ste14
MLGILVIVWAAPTMTAGHLAFAVTMSAYVGVGIALEERDLVATYGSAYRQYRSTTPALLPGFALHRPPPGHQRLGGQGSG